MIEAAVMAELVVKSAVKERLDSMNVSTDLYDALDRKVDDILQAAAQRAEDNDRKTVQPRDL
jgi:histone H3/H4